VTGRKLYQFNAGTMTGRTRNREFHPRDTLDVSPSDARRLGVAQGDRVLLRSRYGETSICVNVDPHVQPGELFATFHEAETFLNRVTGPGRDSVTATPEYKVTAVRIDPPNAIKTRTGAPGVVVASSAPYVPQGTGVSPSQGARK
jgi:formate dehydrogenase major subunit